MPRRKASPRNTKRISRAQRRLSPSPEELMAPAPEPSTISQTRRVSPLSRTKILLAIIIIFLAVFLFKNKGLIVAAMVDNRPIWRWDLESRLVNRYGKQTLDDLITAQLVKEAAAKQKISATPQEVNNRIADVEKSVGGKTGLDQALSQRGITREDFAEGITLQLLAEKMVQSKVTVSESDIDDYLKTNQQFMTATDEATLRQNAKDTLVKQKENQAIQTLLDDLRSKAKITRFI